MANKVVLQVGDKVVCGKSHTVNYGIILSIAKSPYLDEKGKSTQRDIARIQYYNNFCQAIGSPLNSWAHVLSLYEPRHHPLTTIFMNKEEKVVSKPNLKKKKKVDRRRKKV